MLFSRGDVAEYLNANFECAWANVRPVPRIEIDFGNGRRLSRTLNGNVATYFCTPDGRTFDLLPGLADPGEYLRRARLARKFHERIRFRPDWEEMLVPAYHRALRNLDAGLVTAADARRLAGPVVADASKMRVEIPVKEAFLSAVPPATEGGASDLREESAYNRVHRYPKVRDLLARRPLATPAELTATVYRDILGVDLEDPYLGLAPYVLGGEIGRH